MNGLAQHKGPTGDELTVRELVALRLMLADALRRGETAGRYSRGAAVVALDATIERAVYLIAQSRGINVGPRASLPDVYSNVRGDFAGNWDPPTWPLINKLHLERNKVQHQGLEPDRDQLPIWVRAVESFTTSLIAAQYGLDIRKVQLADAIDDPQLRELVAQAVSALEVHDIAASLNAAIAAFDAAVARWTRMHENTYRPSRVSRTGGPGVFERSDRQDAAIESLHQIAAEASFAPSAAEHEWFRAARREPVDVLDADDADRVLNFTFSWIASFEVAAREWAPDRRRRADVAARRTRTEPGPARIDEIVSIDPQHSGFKVTFRLANLPAEPDYDRWSQALNTLLKPRPYDRGIWWRVRPDGTVDLTLDNGVPSADHLNFLADAVEQVEQVLDEMDREAVRLREENDAEAQRMTMRIDQSRDQLPDWVTDISWTPTARLRDAPAWTLVVREVDSLPIRDGGTPYPLVRHLAWDVADILRGHHLVEQCYTDMHNSLTLIPALPIPDLLTVLTSADQVVASYLLELDEIETRRGTVLAQAHADLARAMAIRASAK